MYRILIFTLLMIAWLVLSGLFDVFHITLGVVSCLIVTWMSADLWFQNRSTGRSERLREAARLPGYLGWLLWQVVLANVYTLKLALAPGGIDELSPRMVRFKTTLKSEFARFVLAQSITLTPGTVTVKIVGDEFFVHAISKLASDGLDGSMEGWIKHLYEPDERGKV